MRISLAVLATTTLAAAAWTGTTAAQAAAVASLNPPPPPDYACNAVGDGTICRAGSTFSYGPEVTDIPCTGFAVYDAGTVRETKTRYYDSRGNLTRRVIHDLYSFGQWSNPVTGDAVDYTQNNVQTDVLAAPGDLTTSTQTITGEVIIRAGTGRPVFFATGRQVFNFDESELISSAGRNGFIDAFFRGDTAAFDNVCSALGQ